MRGQPSEQDTGTWEGLDQLAVRFSDFARDLQQQPDPDSTLKEITRSAIEMIPGCAEASVSAIRGRRKIISQAASGTLPQVVDALQAQTGQGPCLDAVHEQRTVRVSDMATETRWPLFTPGALAAGAAGMLSFQLYVEEDNLGSLNLFSLQSGAFTDHSEHVGLLFASHAAVAYSGVQRTFKMGQTVASRQVIGQAQGILMERRKITGDASFALLVQASQDSNLKLREVSDRLIHTGELPAGPSGERAGQTGSGAG